MATKAQLPMAARVGKCHGYDGYIRVKKWPVGVKSLGGQNNYQKQAILGRYMRKFKINGQIAIN